MTVTNAVRDDATRTLTLTSEFSASTEAVWQMWADPRRLERWWAPQPWQATVFEHELRPEGRVTYEMAGPDGSRHFGWWRITAVEAPRYLAFDDGFGDETGEPAPGMPVSHGEVTVEQRDGVTVMTVRTTFDSIEDMEKLLGMGMQEGMTMALSQIDALLREVAEAS